MICKALLRGAKARALRAEAFFDQEDEATVNKYRWRLSKGYAMASIRKNGKRTTISMHRLVAGIVDNPDLEVDHLNGNPLDNRKSNFLTGLRKSRAFRSLQSRRCKAYGNVDVRGVYWNKESRKFYVRMRDATGKRRFYGSYYCKQEASRVYEAMFAEVIEELEEIVRSEVDDYNNEK